MATNLDVITEAYEIADIINERQVLTARQSARGLSLMNDMFSDWEEDGIELGFFPQTVLSATIPIEDNKLRGVKYNLARGVAGYNSVSLSDESRRIAELTFARLEKSTTAEISTDFSHMPLGGRRGTFNINTG